MDGLPIIIQESSSLSRDFTFKGRKWIEDNYGKDYLGVFRSTDIKTAHEAIRPTNINRQDEKIAYIIIFGKQLFRV